MLSPRQLLSLLLVCLLAGSLRAATPREELLRHVSDDVGFCLVVQDLRARFAEVAASPFARAWRNTALVKSALAAPEWRQIELAERYLEKHLGVTWASLRDDLLGEAFVFAYRPGPVGKPDQEQGLFLLRARSEKTLANLVQKFNALQRETGELKGLDEAEHRGVKYFRRQEARTTNYYLLHGPVLAFTGQEAMLKEAIERRQRAGDDSALVRRMKDLKLDQALVGLMVNPRPWDGAITAKGDDPASKVAATAWKALQGVGVALHLDRDVLLSVTVRLKADELPAPARRFIASASRPSELWPNLPADALLAVGGRLDLAALYDFLGECMTKQARQAFEAELVRTVGAMLGKDVAKELLPALGPDWTFCVTAPPAGGKEWAPRLTAALKIARGEEGDPIDQAVLSALRSWAQLALLAHNKQHADRPLTLRSAVVERVRVRYLAGEGVFPAGVQPAFALRAGYLVLSSSPAEIGRFKGGGEGVAEGVPLLRASLKAWRAYLAEHREPLATALARKHGTTKEKAAVRLDDLAGSLELFDRVELRQQSSPGFAAFTLTLTPATPLRK